MKTAPFEDNSVDRNLLFGILALQTDFVKRETLIAAISIYASKKSSELGQILVEQGMLSTESRQLLEALIQEHLKQHGNDPRKCLSSMGSLESVREQLLQLGDDQLRAALGRISTGVSSSSDASETQTIHFGGGPASSA